MGTKNILYALACLSFCLINGAGVYEHIAVWPRAYSEPPLSLTMFQGKYGLESGPFWMSIHPITLVLFIINLVIHWKTERRKFVLYPLIVYVLVLTVTFIYFVPELISLVTTPYSETIDESLKQRGSLWITLSLIRLTILFVTSIALMIGLTKNGQKGSYK